MAARTVGGLLALVAVLVAVLLIRSREPAPAEGPVGAEHSVVPAPAVPSGGARGVHATPPTVDADSTEKQLVATAPGVGAREPITVEEAASGPAEFVVTGRILSGAPLSPASVVYGSSRGSERAETGSLAVDEQGAIGPAFVALDDADSYWFRLEGSDWAVEEITIPRPEPGASIEVNFDGSAGEVMWFLVHDFETSAPLSDSSVQVSWDSDGHETTAVGHARPDGYVRVDGCRPGTVIAIASAPEFAPMTLEHVIPAPTPVTYTMGLWQAGVLTGRVLDRGEPVTDFGIALCPFGRRDETRTTFFAKSVDGTFELNGIPSGDVELVAFAEAHSQSPVTIVIGGDQQPGEIVLELATPCTARGRVVEQANDTPVAAAEVQVFASIAGKSAHALGSPRTVEADGSFELGEIFDGGSVYTVSAPGYSTVTNTAIGEPGRVLDLGTIALVPKQELTIRLESHSSIDPTEYSVSTSRSDRIPPTFFAANGELVIDGMDVGPIGLSLQGPDSRENAVDRVLYSGGEWLIVVPVDGPCRLEVEVDLAEGDELPGQPIVHVIHYEDGGGYVDTVGWMRDGYVAFDLPCSKFTVYLTGIDAAVLGQETIQFDETGTILVRLKLQSDFFFVRVVDAHGAAVSGATVMIGVPGARGKPYRVTDAEGLAKFPSDGQQQDLAGMMSHASLGVIGGIPVFVRGAPDEVIELVFDAPASFEVRLMDGDQPVANVECALVDRPLDAALSDEIQTSDADGYLRFERLGEGVYDLIGSREGYGAIREKVRTSASEPHVIQMQKVDNVDDR